ncbi:signal peptidase I [Brevibacterium sanguinis]|uniref:Signal peptidase I n=2 Tax=Brevibacterium TaxID=1696 RepID=A0A366INL5_9MICO|nr:MULTISPECIES: signal peptidase I [Brevibacterium]RBP67919.1 signal peptidase I [Brevibacterium sanguinis]RBP74664.1 signal peptidase I [Brevibacterium celere]
MPGTAPNDHENATFGSRFRISPRWTKAIAVLAVVIVVLGGSVRGFVFQRFTIPSESMAPTLDVGDEISVWRPDALRGTIDRGDVVVFDGRGSFVDAALPTPLQKMGSWVGLGDRDVYYVKRVIALGGDTLECCDAQGRLLLDGEPLDEDYAAAPASSVEFAVEVPAGTMWVMGDNRADSADSRALLGRPGGGFIPLDRVVGPVIGHGSSID